MTRIIQPSRPLTGTTLRMQCLPHADYSDPELLRSTCEREAFGPSNRQGQQQPQNDMHSEAQAERKCVYKYDDIYKFRRILQADALVFDSHFESGNLNSASRVFRPDHMFTSKQEYDLLLQHDVHSYGHMQWFYFSVSNTTAGMEVQFNIMNFVKSDSMFNDGMRPLILSKLGQSKTGIGWRRCGHDIRYFENGADNTTKTAKQGGGSFHTLTFKHTFEFSDDICYFAYCYPYTYSDLQRYLCAIQSNPARSIHLRRRTLCRTLADNVCDVLTVTAPARTLRELKQRLGVVLTARVHPGESNSSWIMHGIIDFLTSDDPAACKLRTQYIFKIVPMLNPDGVINGNYRTSLAGVDLNRRWDDPIESLHPTIFHTKRLIQRFQKTNRVVLVVDFHGHSRKEGVFMYGNMPTKELFRAERANPKLDELFAWKVRMLPRAWASRSQLFHLANCTFSVQKDKLNTMRVVTFSQCNIDCTYTVEASLAGANGSHFIPEDLLKMGQDFCKSLDDFYLLVAPASAVRKFVSTVDIQPNSLQQEIVQKRAGDEAPCLDDPVSMLPSTAWARLAEATTYGHGSDGSDPEFSDDCKDETDLARSLRRRKGVAEAVSPTKAKLKRRKKKRKMTRATAKKSTSRLSSDGKSAGAKPTRRRAVSATGPPAEQNITFQTLQLGRPPRPGKTKAGHTSNSSSMSALPRRKSTSAVERADRVPQRGRFQSLDDDLVASVRERPVDILARASSFVGQGFTSEEEQQQENDDDDGEREEVTDDEDDDFDFERIYSARRVDASAGEQTHSAATAASSIAPAPLNWLCAEEAWTAPDAAQARSMFARRNTLELQQPDRAERQARPRSQSATSDVVATGNGHETPFLSTARQKSRIEQVISERKARERQRPQSAVLPGTRRRNTVSHDPMSIPPLVSRRPTSDPQSYSALPLLKLRSVRSDTFA